MVYSNTAWKANTKPKNTQKTPVPGRKNKFHPLNIFAGFFLYQYPD